MSADAPNHPLTPSADPGELEAALGYRFARPELLRQALTHPSLLNESPEPGTSDNQRLEFLGDAVLELVVSEALVAAFPEDPEGQLTKRRALVVSEAGLQGPARGLSLGRYLRLGRGEELSGGRRKSSVLSDAFEALAAALFLDGGFEGARRVLLPLLEPAVAAAQLGGGALLDPKSRLQELSQAHWGKTPQYRALASEGPEHSKRFLAEVRLGDAVWGLGWGGNKKDAQQTAAALALEILDDALLEGVPSAPPPPPSAAWLERRAEEEEALRRG